MSSLTPSEQAMIAAVDPAATLARTESWARINSGSRNLDGLARMAGALADAFAALPGEIVLEAPAPVTAIAPDGSRTETAHGAHLVQTVRPAAPVQLLFTGHMDTVFAADHPFQALRREGPDRLNGPGVADMKGGLSLLLEGLLALERSPVRDRIGYQLMINSDEEVGSPSSAALIARLAAGKRAAFTYEPALPDGTLAGARGGSGNFSLIVRGRSAHAGRNPEEGRNAIVAAADLAVRLKALTRPGLSVNPARIDGGGPNNVVPDLAIVRVNVRPRDAAAEAEAIAAIDEACGQIALDHDVVVEAEGGFGRPPKPIDAGAAALFDHVRRCGADLGLTIGWRDTGGVCDGNNIAACGVPVVDTMGARGGAIHSDQEFLLIDSLAERAALTALSVARLGGADA